MSNPKDCKIAGAPNAKSHLDSRLISELDVQRLSKKGDAVEDSGIHNALDSAIAAIQIMNRKRKQPAKLGDAPSSSLHERIVY